jgi:ATP-dependent exoDNAse (exonuclease V) beta subunit
VISQALAAADIPVTAADIDPLIDQSVVADLVALTRALLHLGDRTAWLAVLRAPWCGLQLGALLAVVGNDRAALVWERITDPAVVATLDGGDRARLATVIAALEPALDAAGRGPITRVVEDAWRHLRGPECLTRTLELHHAERFLELLAGLERREAQLTPQRLERALARHFAPPPPGGGSRVAVMTIHRAKGLEFDCVILPGMGRSTRSERKKLLMWHQQRSASGATGLFFAPIPDSGAADEPMYEFLRLQESSELVAESHRLLYVALTRAREQLHLVVGIEVEDGEIRAPRKHSFLAMMWPIIEDRLNPNADPASSACAGGSSPRTVPRNELRRLTLDGQEQTVWQLTPRPTALRSLVEFGWASPAAKHIGTVTHAMLNRIGADGISQWSVDRVDGLGPYTVQRLRALGIAPGELDTAAARVTETLCAVLDSERGRWILAEGHGEARNEFPLTTLSDGRFANVLIDRTFVDDGVRWIIDYKTGVHAGGSEEAFIASEVERYTPQLERYARIMRGVDQRPIRLGLYFPLLGGWHEWAFDEE